MERDDTNMIDPGPATNLSLGGAVAQLQRGGAQSRAWPARGEPADQAVGGAGRMSPVRARHAFADIDAGRRRDGGFRRGNSGFERARRTVLPGRARLRFGTSEDFV